jgi:type I restriction enzyme S subunit
MQVDLLMANGADEPVSIEHLRKAILDLAVRGKLVEQRKEWRMKNPPEETGEELLHRILAERRKRWEEERFANFEAKGKKPSQNWKENYKEPVAPDTNELPELPKGWCSGTVEMFALLVTKGTTPTSHGFGYRDEGVRFIRTEDLSHGQIVGDGRRIGIDAHEFLARSQLKEGDVLFSIAGSIGKSAVVREKHLPANTNQALGIIRISSASIIPSYLLLALRGGISQDYASRRARGGAMNNISLGDLKSLLIAVPPIREQHRIVAKVDELMPLIDQLGEAQAHREEIRIQTRQTCLHALVENGEWDRVRDNWDSLFTTPESVDDLRKAILDLAVRGRLVEQREEEGTGEDLVSRAKTMAVQLVADGDLPKPRKIDRPEDIARPFHIPENWWWARLEDVAPYIQRGKSPKYAVESTVPVVSQKCVQWSGFDPTLARFVTEISLNKYGSERFLVEGDLLWNSTGTGTIGRVNVFGGVPGYQRVVADSHVTVVRTVEMSPNWVWVWLASPSVQDDIEDRASGTTNQIELNQSMARLQETPIPPLSEQHRIVAKVDELMALCDDLEARLREVAEISEQLAESVVHHVAA